MKSLSHVQLLASPWTVAHQAPLSMGFSRQECWSGVPLPSLLTSSIFKLFSLYIFLHFKIAQSCPTLCDPMDYRIHGILQARILEHVAFSLSRGSSEPRSPALKANSLPAEPQGKPKNAGVGSLSLLQWIFLTQESNWGLLHSGGFLTN